MEENLLITYHENDKQAAGYDLGLLGESFTGFNDVFKELFTISKIQGDLVLRTTKISQGSIDVQNIVDVVINGTPFSSVSDLLDFLRVADQQLYQEASNFFNAIGNGHKAVNDFFKEYEFSGAVVSGLVSGFIVSAVEWSGLQKKRVTTEDSAGNQISETTARKLRTLVLGGKFKRALKPISENSVSKVALASHSVKKVVTNISEVELGNYLPDDEEILPQLVNGTVIQLVGEIQALQSTKGETVKFKAAEIEKKFQLLTAYPADGKQTEDYKDFYKKQVILTAEVFRKTLYKKPELIIQDIKLSQDELFHVNSY